MGVIQRIKKPSTHRSKRELEKRESKLIENPKQAVFIRGATANASSLQCMKDLYSVRRSHATLLSRKHDLNPFEDVTPIEGLGQKMDASLFSFCSHNKKRPNNIVLGRMFDARLLDMVELGVDEFKSIEEFKNQKVAAGIKPCLIFAGESFNSSPEYQRLKNLLVDFFRGEDITGLRLAGLEHVMMFTSADGKIFLRSYRIVMKKSGAKTPRVELEEIGPRMDITIRRTKLASADLFKSACKKPFQAKVKITKNIKKDALGTKMGRIHLGRQDLSKLQYRRMKGLRGERKPKSNNKKTKKPKIVAATTDEA